MDYLYRPRLRSAAFGPFFCRWRILHAALPPLRIPPRSPVPMADSTMKLRLIPSQGSAHRQRGPWKTQLFNNYNQNQILFKKKNEHALCRVEMCEQCNKIIKRASKYRETIPLMVWLKIF
jgi:hypothetical protein